MIFFLKIKYEEKQSVKKKSKSEIKLESSQASQDSISGMYLLNEFVSLKCFFLS